MCGDPYPNHTGAVSDQRKILKQMKMGTTEFLVLVVLNEKDRYGYEITREIHDRSDGFFEFKQGFLYPALRRMEGEELITGYWRRSDSGGPDRKYYKLTAEGVTRLGAFIEAWSDFSSQIDRLLTTTVGYSPRGQARSSTSAGSR